MENKIHTLVKVLEQLQDDLDFTVSYTYEEFLESRHFCPAFDFEGYYYEIQYDNLDQLQVLRWLPRAGNDEAGYVLEEKEIEDLIKDLTEIWAEKMLKTTVGNWQHFLREDIITPYFTEDVIYSIKTEKLTPEEIIERYKDLLSEKEIKNLKL